MALRHTSKMSWSTAGCCQSKQRKSKILKFESPESIACVLLFVDIDECADKPCLNGGNCTDFVSRYDCSCSQDHYGSRCQWSKNLHIYKHSFMNIEFQTGNWNIADLLKCHHPALIVLWVSAKIFHHSAQLYDHNQIFKKPFAYIINC